MGLPAEQLRTPPTAHGRARSALNGAPQPESGTRPHASRLRNATPRDSRSTFLPNPSKQKGPLVGLSPRPTMRIRSTTSRGAAAASALGAPALASFLGLVSACAAPAPTSDGPDEPAFVSVGDRIHVRADEPSTIDGWHTIDIHGHVCLPKLGEVAIAGLIPDEIETLLEEKLAARLGEVVELDVRVAAAPKQYHVFGEVERIGAHDHGGDVMLFEAVMSADPHEARADLAHVRLFRSGPSARGGALDLTIDLRPMTERGDSTLNVAIQPGDVILVPAVPTATAETAR